MILRLLCLVAFSFSPLAWSAIELVGEATLVKKQWLLTTRDKESGAKKVYRLVGFNAPGSKNHFKGDFLYTRVKGREVPCKGSGTCFEVAEFAAEFYDPLKDRMK